MCLRRLNGESSGMTCKLCNKIHDQVWVRPTFERLGEICTPCFKLVWKEDYAFCIDKKCEPWQCVICHCPIEPRQKDSLGISVCEACKQYTEAQHGCLN